MNMQLTLDELRLIQRALLDEFNVLDDLIDTVGIPIDKLVDKQNQVYDVMQKINDEIERLEEDDD